MALFLDEGVQVEEIHHAHKCDDYRALYLMATQSDAVLFAHEFISHNDYFTDKLCRLPTQLQMPNAAFSVALPLHPTPSPLARRYVELLRDETAFWYSRRSPTLLG